MLDKVQKNRVLVTGAAGFIGANLCLNYLKNMKMYISLVLII